MKTLENYYKKFRAAGMGGIVGEDAKNCLHAARILMQWEDGEDDEKVRLRICPEGENYFSVYGEENISKKEDDNIRKQIDLWGCVSIISEYRDENDRWHIADSIGMCIYKNPASPFENCYIIDLMESALAHVTQPEYSI